MSSTSASPHRFRFKAMASPCELVICGVDKFQAEKICTTAQAEVLRIESKFSRYQPDSLLTRINQNAGAEAVTCDVETLRLFDIADTIYRSSLGLFDITSGILRQAWNFQSAAVPEQTQIDRLLPLINWPSVERDGKMVRLPLAGMEIDFGGFGKEYAADQAAEIMYEAGISSGYVNLAGDFRVLGPKPGGDPWILGVQHPRNPGEVAASIPVAGGGFTSSGDYERFFEKDGKRYCHILNPRTGYPVSHWQSVSVLAANALLAGSFCTIAMLQEAAGLNLLQQSGFPFLAIDQQGKHWHDTGATL